ncbi:MAG: CDP-alcohol phosphatidyltransferase family protein [Coriobacteriales bacterium]|nr:CDP-alcohol phosphatidyltransferase family protein [Coriobacteriales bacterium]
MADNGAPDASIKRVKRTGEDRIITVPNVISAIRILLIPAFYIIFVTYRMETLGCAIFIVASCSDWIDGRIARATNSVTKLGKTLDPLADRLLIIFGVIALFVVDRLPLWIMIAIFLRDLLLLRLTIWLGKEYDEGLTVAYIGKVATTFVMAAFAMLLFGWPTVPGFGLFEVSWLPGFGASECYLGILFAYIGVILQWVTAFVYFYRGLRYGTTKKGVSLRDLVEMDEEVEK